jgi:hypothetical protein
MSQKKVTCSVCFAVVAVFCSLVLVSCVSSTTRQEAGATPAATTFIADGGSTPTEQPNMMQTPAPATSQAASATTPIPASTSSYQAPIPTSNSTPLAPKPTPTHTLSVTPIAPTATPLPIVAPTPLPAATPTQPVAAPTGVNGNPWGFDFNPGSTIYGRYVPSTFCSYFSCISSFWNGNGYVVECQDGMYSKSGGLSGSCSHHGGNAAILYQHSS